MTAIAAFVDSKKTVWMGGDAAATGTSLDLSTLSHPKVLAKKGLVLGYSGSIRMGNILEHCFDPPPHDPDMRIEAYVCTSFLPSLRDAFASHCYAKSGAGEHMPSDFLIGHQGRILRIQSDFGLLCRNDPYDSCGSGEDICLGALHVLGHDKNADGRKVVLRALEAAEANSAAVRGPFTILKLPFTA